MPPRIFISAAVMTLGVCWTLRGAEEPNETTASAARLISFDDLQARLGDPQLRLLDVRPRAAYEQGHLPGAVWVDPKATEEFAAKPGRLTDQAAWEEWIAPLGLEAGTEVYVYDANRQKDAARFWWLLSYLGVEKVGLVDGNFPLWAKQGRPVSSDGPEIEAKPFQVKFQSDRHADRADVLKALGSQQVRIVDARTQGEYLGTMKLSKREGRIPTACHLEWAELVDKDGKFLDADALKTKLSKAGVKPGEPVIAHCQGGGRASVDAFVLERLGYPTRNYYLGWSDWGNAEDTPVETGEAPDPDR